MTTPTRPAAGRNLDRSMWVIVWLLAALGVDELVVLAGLVAWLVCR